MLHSALLIRSCTFTFLLLCALYGALPPHSHHTDTTSDTNLTDTSPDSIFPRRNYTVYQISSGVTGKAQEASEAVFVTPFAHIALRDVSKEDLKNLDDMAQEALAKEQDFNTAIKNTKDKKKKLALKRGKTSNKVLKLQGALQVVKILEAKNQGVNVSSRKADLSRKLTENIRLDTTHKNLKTISFLDLNVESKEE